MTRDAMIHNIMILVLLFAESSIFTQTLFSADTVTQWTTHAFNLSDLGTDHSDRTHKSAIRSFYPLGFSKDGWFAYCEDIREIELPEPEGYCDHLPCYAIHLFNTDCEKKCFGDVDPDSGDKCKCVFGVNKEHLTRYGIQPLTHPRYGRFPAELLNDIYDIELVFKEKAIYPEIQPTDGKSIPEFPETSLYLVSEALGRKQIGRIDHNHEGIVTGVRPFGWIKNPFRDDIVVLLLGGDAVTKSNGDPATMVLIPFGADIKRGFAKKGPD